MKEMTLYCNFQISSLRILNDSSKDSLTNQMFDKLKFDLKFVKDFYQKKYKGLLQNCYMSPILFKFYVVMALIQWTRKSEEVGVRHINEKYIFNLVFVDDEVLIAQDEKILST